jgi:hypothetical protein
MTVRAAAVAAIARDRQMVPENRRRRRMRAGAQAAIAFAFRQSRNPK